MNIRFEISLATNYKSPTQKVRVLTEGWVRREAYCPACGEGIEKFPNNNPVGDFYCTNCRDNFELKSKSEKFGKKIVDGEASSMERAVKAKVNPNFFLLTYKRSGWNAKDLFVVPAHYFNMDLIEVRQPLSLNARRHGWQGCNILISRVPKSGMIFMLKEGQEVSKKIVLENWKKTSFLKEVSKERGWTLDVMRAIENLKSKEFKLIDLYAYEEEFHKLRPGNFHIKDKIRQQLQILRDAGYLKFIGNGSYQIL